MKRISYWIMVTFLASSLLSCSGINHVIKEKIKSEKTGIFDEASPGDMVPTGYALLVIKTNIKTHIEGYYPLESKKSLHGKKDYPFLFNIDGQAVVWKVDGVIDTKPFYDDNRKTSRDPEAGEGMKYILKKKIRLKAGTHRVFFGLFEDNYALEIEITLKEGETGSLEFKPIYSTKKIPLKIPTFLKGIDKYEVFFNGIDKYEVFFDGKQLPHGNLIPHQPIDASARELP